MHFSKKTHFHRSLSCAHFSLGCQMIVVATQLQCSYLLWPQNGIISSLRYFCGFLSSPESRHLHPNRGCRTLRGEHSVTRYTCTLSNRCCRADGIVVQVSILPKNFVSGLNMPVHARIFIPVIQQQSYNRNSRVTRNRNRWLFNPCQGLNGRTISSNALAYGNA